MTDWVKDKTVLVTAAGQGIGRATALAFAARGAKVVATDINETALSELEGSAGIEIRRLDVLKDTDVQTVVAETGPVDVLFNGAGFVHAGSILEMKDEDFDFAVDLNVRSMIRTIRAVLPAMLERGGGAIINMAQLLVLNASSPGLLPQLIEMGTMLDINTDRSQQHTLPSSII